MARMTAADVARQAGGKRCGFDGYVCHCPVEGHGKGRGDINPSLSVRDGKNRRVILKCFAGCDWRDVRDAAVARGWIDDGRRLALNLRSRLPAKRLSSPTKLADTAKRDLAMKLFDRSQSIADTLAETYLASRGLCSVTSDALRFHPHLKHPSGEYAPALVALITHGADATPLAIHRTFIARDGQGKAAVEPQRMMLGPVRGGCVRLAPGAEHILIGEGIETCLACMQATGLPAWAALTTSGFHNLELPPEIGTVTILCDGDQPGQDAAKAAAARWTRQSRQVRIAHPPKGQDFNDVLRSDPEVGSGGAT